MYLYLVQHAEAMSKEADPSRSLTEQGMEDVRRVAGLAAGMKIHAHQIIHSGKMRALQTAQAIGAVISHDMGVVESDGMAPMDDPRMWAERIALLNHDIMLVGHLPHLDKLAALLVTGSAETSAVNFEMGAMVCLKKSDEGNWAVDWLIKPRMLL